LKQNKFEPRQDKYNIEVVLDNSNKQKPIEINQFVKSLEKKVDDNIKTKLKNSNSVATLKLSNNLAKNNKNLQRVRETSK